MKRASPAGQQTLLNAVPVDSIANVNQVDGDHWLPCSPSDNPLQIMAESFQSSSNDRPTAFNDEDVPSHLTVAAYAYWILGMFGAHRPTCYLSGSAAAYLLIHLRGPYYCETRNDDRKFF